MKRRRSMRQNSVSIDLYKCDLLKCIIDDFCQYFKCLQIIKAVKDPTPSLLFTICMRTYHTKEEQGHEQFIHRKDIEQDKIADLSY